MPRNSLMMSTIVVASALGIAGLSHCYLNFRLTIVVFQVDRDEPVQQGILSLMDTGVFFRIRGKDRRKIRMYLQVALPRPAQFRQIQDAFRQNAQESVIRLRSRTVELVVDQSITVLTGSGKPVVHPETFHFFFGFENGVYEVVDQFGLAITCIAAHEIGTSEFIISVDESNRATKPGGDMEGKGGLPRTCRTREMNRVSRPKIGKSPLRHVLHIGRGDKSLAGLRQDVVFLGLNPQCSIGHDAHLSFLHFPTLHTGSEF